MIDYYKPMIGRTIVEVREMTEEEKEEFDWWGHCPVIVLDDGQQIVVSQDGEGNGPGALFVD